MIYATVLAQAMLDADTANGPKPTARNTPFRYSGAHGCSRQLAYSALKAKPSEPWDIASAYVTGLGTILHESWQSAMAVAYPDAEFEVGSQVNDLLSGSCDAVIADAVVEVKTRGAYAFEKETGIGRYKRTEGSGPSLSAITQVGMNVIGLQRDRPSLSEVCLVTLPREAISVQRAKKLGLSDEERIAAEWWYEFEDVEMYARDEIVRVDEIAEQLQDNKPLKKLVLFSDAS